MSAAVEGPTHIKVYPTKDGRAVIEQSQGSVALDADQILAVISELRVCYDYCAAWKESKQE
jgi:hypothetical protein